MCGITGIYGLKEDHSAQVIRAMNKCIAHRGPDDEGYYTDAEVALGHRRLAIIDLSPAGHQPMKSNDGLIEIIFNGEIYNFREVKKMIPDYNFKSGSDTEVIIAAYQKWGKQCVNYFNGMFAFAVWDKQKKELFIARDRMGIKPVYYYKKDNVFLFGSEIRALLESGLVPRKLNRSAIHEFFVYQTVHAPQTLIKDVMMLMPGHYAIVKNNNVTIEEYWNVARNADYSSEGKSYKEVCKKVEQLFVEAVERRLVSDVPFGAFLSGGIDSSAVVGIMSRIHSQPVKTFNIAFDESEFSEARFASMVADKFKTDHHEFLLKPEDFLEQLPEAMNALDHPSGDGPNSYIVSKITRKAGITMALSGLGGDELFAGYPVFRYAQKMHQQKWLWTMPQPLRSLLASGIVMAKNNPQSEKLAQYIRSSSYRVKDTFAVSRQISSIAQLEKFISEKYTGNDRVKQLVQALLKENEKLPLLSQVSVAEISTYMQNVLLRDTDQMSMAVALEVRVPFLDHKLVEYVMGISDSVKNPEFPKKLLVESLGDLLPDEVVHRKKMGFVFPWQRWLKSELKEFCDKHIQSLAEKEFVNKEGLLNRWNRFLSGAQDVRWLDMWLCVVLEHWLEKNKIEN